MEKIVNLGKRI